MKSFGKFIASTLAAVMLIGGIGIANTVNADTGFLITDMTKDTALREYFSRSSIDQDQDGKLTMAERNAVTNIDVTSMGVRNPIGIAYFPNLEVLKLSNNIYIDSNGYLKDLLRNSSMSNLKTLFVNNCNLTYLPLENLHNLTVLSCTSNNLESLHLYHCPNLLPLMDSTPTHYTSYYQFGSGSNYLRLGENMDDIDIFTYPASDYFTDSTLYDYACRAVLGRCPTSRGSTDYTFTYADEHITYRFLQRVGSVTEFDCSSMYSSNITSMKGMELFTSLENFNAVNKRFVNLDLSGCHTIININVSGNSTLTNINLGDNPVENLNVSGCNLSKLSITYLDSLQTVNCDNNSNLTSVNLYGCYYLRTLNCSSCSITSLRLGGCNNLQTLVARGNQFTTLDLSSCTNVTNVNISNNPKLKNLDVSLNTVLDRLATCFPNTSTVGVFETHTGTVNGANRTFTYDKTLNLTVHEHVYADAYCDTTCDICGRYQFDEEHFFTSSECCAACVMCGYRAYPAHSYTDEYDATCNNPDCHYLRSVPTRPTTPTGTPTTTPTGIPTPVPTGTPSQTPTTVPTPVPTGAPTGTPANPSENLGESGVGGFVERLYTIALDRNSDPNGKADWVNRVYTDGATGADVARGFLFSQEFLGKEMSNQDFLAVLYRVFFDRAGDQGGIDYWLSQMANGMDKQTVIMGFINSTEWANVCLRFGIASGGNGVPNISIEPSSEIIDFATRLYTTCLCRNADSNGLNDWAHRLANRQISGSDAARGFFFSAEFMNDSSIDNAEYINRLYQTFMGRPADQGGFDDWMNRMNNGATREDVFNGFAGSQE